MVFLHGLGCELEVWRRQLEHVRTSRRAVAYDQRGHGRSDRARDGVYTIEALAADLEAVRAGLGIERMVLVGHSMSGAVITTYAGRHPGRVAGLVYVDAIGDFSAVPAEAFAPAVAREAGPGFGPAQIRAEFEGMFGPAARPATRAAVLDSASRLDPPAFAALRRELFALREGRHRLAPWRGPALAIEAADAPYPTVLAARVLEIPRTSVVGVSHWLQLDDPAALNEALDAFLGGADG